MSDNLSGKRAEQILLQQRTATEWL
ncbi:hypothetical protein PM8797T_00879 [Gimesia maris DSM 8797]|nr:hypothetical protein PM8797T_00879 [Gimesia maris DSM 8797]